MTTLEGNYLQRNVPGRYPSWSEEEEEEEEEARDVAAAHKCCSGQPEDEIDHDERCYYDAQEQTKELDLDRSSSSSSSSSSRNPGGFRTGPKGVLADYNLHQRAVQQHQALEAAHRQRVLLRIARGSSSDSDGILPTIDEEEGDDDEEEDEDDDDDDAAFISAYRAQRLQRLKQQQQATGIHEACPRPLFGQVEEVSGFGMVDIIENLRIRSPTTKIIVHVYEPHVPACRQVKAFWPTLATKHPAVRFLRLHQGCNLPSNDLRLDTAVLPMLLVYQHGTLSMCLARLDASLGVSFLCEDLEEWLADQGVWEEEE